MKNVCVVEPKVKSLLSLMATACNKSSDFEKRRFLSLMRGAGFTLKEVQAAGFICYNDAWRTAGKHCEEFFPGSKVSEIRGRPAINVSVVKEIVHKFLMTEEISRPSPNKNSKKTVDGISTYTPVQYFNITKKEVFRIFRKKTP